MTYKEPVRQDLQMPKRRANLNSKSINLRKGVGTFYTGTPEVRTWLKSYVKGHWFFYTDKDTQRLWIAFHDKQDALLWKLTWH